MELHGAIRASEKCRVPMSPHQRSAAPRSMMCHLTTILILATHGTNLQISSSDMQHPYLSSLQGPLSTLGYLEHPCLPKILCSPLLLLDGHLPKASLLKGEGYLLTASHLLSSSSLFLSTYLCTWANCKEHIHGTWTCSDS